MSGYGAGKGERAVSVVAPRYKSEAHLAECLDSVLAQTFTDFEVIVVDDGSTDSSVEKASVYTKLDDRVRVETQENAGPGIARNRGIECARGEYLYFLDSDDFCDEHLLESAVGHAKATGADVVAFPYMRFDMRVNVPVRAWWCLPPERVYEGVRSWRDFPDNLFETFHNLVWNKLFRKSLIDDHGIRFSDLYLTEDLMFTAQALLRARGIATFPEPLVYHREGTGANTMSNKDRHPFDFIEAFKQLKSFLEECGYMQGVRTTYLNWAVDGCIYNVNLVARYDTFIEVFERLAKGDAEAIGLFVEDRSVYVHDHFRWFLEALERDDPNGYLFELYRRADEDIILRDVQLAAQRLEIDATHAERDSMRLSLEAARAKMVDYEAELNSAEYRVGRVACKVPRMVQGAYLARRRAQ